MPESLPISSDQKYEKIVKNYEVLHRLFFGLGIFILLTIIGVFVARSIILKKDEVISRWSADIITEDRALSGMRLVFRQYDDHPLIKLFIKQWDFVFNPLRIRSNNNLITYKWFVLPKYFSGDANNTLQNIQYFTSTWNITPYDPNELANYLKTIVFSPILYEDESQKKEMNFIDIQGNLIDYFWVNCLKNDKIIDTFCHIVVENMISVLPVYQLSQDFSSLESIGNLVRKTDMNKPFCDSIKQYIYFSNNISDTLKLILNNCGPEYADFYNQFALFRSTQDQLSKQFIDPQVTANLLINAYKLISTQQFIYNELNGNKFNEIRIRNYNQYVEELLRRKTQGQDMVDPFYLDVISLFNNQYLIKELNLLALKSNAKSAKEIKAVLEKLRQINGWDLIAGYEGLSKYSAFKGTVDLENLTIINNITIEKALPDLFREQYTFENFVPSSITQWSLANTLDVVWMLRLYAPSELKGNIATTMQLLYDKDKFFVDSITMSQYPLLTNNLNKFLKENKNTVSISSLYDLITKDGVRLNTKPKSICETIATMAWLVSCTDKNIVIVKKTQEIGNIKYSITHDNGSLVSYTISDPDLYKKALADLQTPSTTSSSFLVFLESLMSYKPIVDIPVDPLIVPNGGAQAIQITNDFSILWATVERITKVWELYSVEFTLKDIKFVAAYDIGKQNILWMAIVAKWKKFPLKSFTLLLKGSSNADIDYFVKDPKWFLLQKDPLTVKKAF